ncbi:protein SERAC1-like [Tubulanus polymorphus]|uniref:protein SERAC1-like n=1 Tax=Tubulanus polymorphus TaxID=672921 RepID=UPI003DA389E9
MYVLVRSEILSKHLHTALYSTSNHADKNIRKLGKYTAIGVFGFSIFGGLFLFRQYSSLEQSLHSIDQDVFELERGQNSYIYIDNTAQKDEEEKRKKKNAVWFPWLQRFSSNPWTLLKIARSPDHNVRLLGVRALSETHGWHDSEYRQIAQAVDARTLIGLARSPKIDKRFFLPPPRLPSDMECTEDNFRKLLSALPTTGIDQCTQYFTSNALSEGKQAMAEERGGLWCFGGNGLSFAQSLSAVPPEKVEKFCLEALIRHSKVNSHRLEVVKRGGLQLLQQINLERSSSSQQILHCVGQVIANLAMRNDLRADLICSGWVSILVSWLKSSDLCLSLEAARALANLDRDFGPEKYTDGIYLIHPIHRSSEPVYADVVFVHGLLGGAFKTWRQQDPEEGENTTELTSPCWPKDWLAKDCPNIRIICVDYDTYLSEWAPKCPFEVEKRSLQVRGKEILEKLHLAGVGNRPIVWVGHSMGGLLIKQMLLESWNSDSHIQSMARKTLGVIFYSVPHKGSSLAAYSTQAKFLLNPSIEVKELCQDSQMLRQLHQDFTKLAFSLGFPVLSFGELEKMDLGLNVKAVVVPPESSDPGFGEYYRMKLNHLTICKPKNLNSELYQITLDFIRDCIGPDWIGSILEANFSEQDYMLPSSVDS